jgi:hypothetical protein
VQGPPVCTMKKPAVQRLEDELDRLRLANDWCVPVSACLYWR